MESELIRDAKEIFNYLYLRDQKCAKVDLIIGFGHFDFNIPRQCAHLYQKGGAKKILFTGGRGAGTADLEEAEAIAFREVLANEFPQIPDGDIILESKSTNTGENILLSAAMLKARDERFSFDNGISSIIAVASPYRQRRVWRTLQKHMPQLKVYNKPPETTFESEMELFDSKGEDFIQLLIGEVKRIMSYPDKGYMLYDDLPERIYNLYTSINK